MVLTYGVSEHWSHFVRVILYNLVMLNKNTMLTNYCVFTKLICMISNGVLSLCKVNTEKKISSNFSQLIILRNFYGWQISFSTYFWWYWINFLNFCPEKTVMSAIWWHRRYETYARDLLSHLLSHFSPDDIRRVRTRSALQSAECVLGKRTASRWGWAVGRPWKTPGAAPTLYGPVQPGSQSRFIARSHHRTQSLHRPRVPHGRQLLHSWNVYIIMLCPENTLNDTGTTLNWIPGTHNLVTYRTPGRFPVFFILFYFVAGTQFYRKHTTPARTTRLVCVRVCVSACACVWCV